jgi:hypothetical protein
MSIFHPFRAINTRPALIACLVWAASLGAGRANDCSQSLAADAPLCVSEQDSDCSACEPTVQSAPMIDNLSKSPCQANCGKAAWPQSMFSSISCASAEDAAESPVWRWIPLGMVPYIGPRTPDSMKDLGIGVPLGPKGWRSQPFSITSFVGVTDGGAFIPGHVNQKPSVYAGLNFGWDYDHYWGIEKRLGFGALNLTNGNHQALPTTGLSVTGEYRLMYYPLGDTRWRPFLTTGLGWSDFYFSDDTGKSRLETLGMIPFGLGLKYLYTDRIAVRIDLIDEYTFGNNLLSNFDYLAFTGGIEIRYGHKLLRMPWSHK